MKKSIKIVSVVLMILAMVLVSTSVFATKVERPSDVEGIISTEDTGKIADAGGRILGIIRVVGTIIAVGMIIVLGIKYMMGSAEERAEYKKTLFPYFIGAVLIFAASNLADMIYVWAQDLAK